MTPQSVNFQMKAMKQHFPVKSVYRATQDCSDFLSQL